MKNDFDYLMKHAKDVKNDRIFSEIEFITEISKANNGKHDEIIDKAVVFLKNQYEQNGGLTFKDTLEAENILEPLKDIVKEYEIICVGHSHIDVNWQWGIDETVNITISSFETILRLMDLYPDFVYAQSQAYLYDLIAEYRPDMLERIKEKVKDGRWELTCSTYVENDSNMIDMNSYHKQFLFSKERISKLLDVDPNILDLDFEPDTFGHSIYSPEVLTNCGIKYLYHCRGNYETPFYKWSTESGKTILTYREPRWYLGEINPHDFTYVPKFCKENNIKTVLKVFGIGDHGGGANIKDVEKLKELSTWPLFPRIHFGSFHDYFHKIEKIDNIKEVRGEQNFVFSGCYSSVYKIKKMNALMERNLYSAELWCSIDKSRNYTFEDALKSYLPTHFHDTITGSNVENAKEFALGQLQLGLARTGANKSLALYNLSKEIDTSKILTENLDLSSTSFGAGAGYLNASNNFAVSLGYGKERAIAIFNPVNRIRTEVVDIQIWDYSKDINKLEIIDAFGKPIRFGVKNPNGDFYWYHNFIVVSVLVTVPALGYTTILLREKDEHNKEPFYFDNPRQEAPKGDIVFQNNTMKVVFDKNTYNVKSIIRNNGTELINGEAGFELIHEDPHDGMISWLVGKPKDIKKLDKVSLIGTYANNVMQGLIYKIEATDNTLITVEVVLRDASSSLDYKVHISNREIGDYTKGIPQFRFAMNVNPKDKVSCDVPGGIIDRKTLDMNVPCLSSMFTNEIGLFGLGIHGYRFADNTIYATLIRNSFEPYNNPELGEHDFEFSIITSPTIYSIENKKHPVDTITLEKQVGTKPLEYSYLEVDRNLIVTSITDKYTILTNPFNEKLIFSYGKKQIEMGKLETKLIK